MSEGFSEYIGILAILDILVSIHTPLHFIANWLQVSLLAAGRVGGVKSSGV
jgi:hypothetical protein